MLLGAGVLYFISNPNLFIVDYCPLYSCLHIFIFAKMDIKKKFGEKVKSLRTEKGWSQEKLALTADLDRTYIPSIEAGKRNVSITVIEKIAIALDINIVDLFQK